MLPRVKECEGINLHTPKWTPIVGIRIPNGLSKFQRAISGDKPCDIFYIIRKLLKRRCLKWAHIAHLDIWNTSHGQKKVQSKSGRFLTKKSGINPIYLSTEGVQHTIENYNFVSDHISIGGLLAKLWGSKVARVPTWAISGFPLGSLETKNHLDVSSVASHEVYYKGEGGGFPQVRAVLNLVCPCCPWFILSLKVLQLRTYHLVWVLCRPVWVSEACQLFVVPSRSSNTPLYPSKCCELGSVPWLLLLLLFSTWAHIWVLWGVGSASIIVVLTCGIHFRP
jgi:hypothetical protein